MDPQKSRTWFQEPLPSSDPLPDSLGCRELLLQPGPRPHRGLGGLLHHVLQRRDGLHPFVDTFGRANRPSKSVSGIFRHRGCNCHLSGQRIRREPPRSGARCGIGALRGVLQSFIQKIYRRRFPRTSLRLHDLSGLHERLPQYHSHRNFSFDSRRPNYVGLRALGSTRWKCIAITL